MKKLIMLVGLLLTAIICTPTQAQNKTQMVFGTAGDYKTISTRGVGNSISPALLGDEVVLYGETDSTGQSPSGNLLVKVELYYSELGGWTVSPDSLLDTIPATLANTEDGARGFYVRLEDLAGWAYADSTRFVFTTGAGLKLKAWISGR